MSVTFRPLTSTTFAQEVDSFVWARPILRVDMHHTYRPDHARTADIGIEAALTGMHRAHLDRGFDDIAQHATIARDGTIWTGRDWNVTPASVGYGMNANVFMFEIIGNFDDGCDTLVGAQLDASLAVITAVQRRFALPPFSLLFHRDVPQTDKTCPGSAISKSDILRRLTTMRASRPTPAGAPDPSGVAADASLVTTRRAV